MASRVAALLLLSQAARTSAAVCAESTNPMLGIVTDISPECFQGCPQLCQPLDGIVAEYMANADTAAIQRMVCRQQEPFRCMFLPANDEACQKVLSAASMIGVTLPTSFADLAAQCAAGPGGGNEDVGQASANQTTDALDVASGAPRPAAAARSSAGVCADIPSPELSFITDLSPACFEACPQLCQPFDDIMRDWTSKGSPASVQEKVCSYQEPLSCMFLPANSAECRKVLSHATEIGMAVPASAAELCAAAADTAGSQKFLKPKRTTTATTTVV